MKAERIPLQKMETRKAKHGEKLALVDQLVALVEAVRKDVNANGNAKSLRELSWNTREDIVGVTLDKNVAQPGNYQLEVVQLAQKSSAITSGFEDPDDSYVGVGFIQFYMPDGSTKDIYVDSDHSSLKGISKLINSDQSNGLTANVINDGSGTDNPWKLIMTFEETGDAARAEYPYFYFVDGINDFYIEQERPAHDAKIKLDGFEIELPSNKAENIIPGVTLDLKKAAPGEEFGLQIDEDAAKITEKVQTLVDELNGVISFIKEQNTLDEKSDTSRTLGGDLILQTLETRIRSTVFKDIETKFGFRRMGDLGLTFQRDGSLSFESKKFEKQLSDNYEMVAQTLTGYFKPEGGKSLGFMEHLKDLTNTALRDPDGLLKSRKRSIRTRIDQIDRRIETKERMLETKEKNLKNKFARLEGTISRIQTQGAGLAALGAQAPSLPQLG